MTPSGSCTSMTIQRLGLTDFDAYLQHVDQEPGRGEFAEMIDALTTNKTSFLREAQHFDFLRTHVLPTLAGPVRLWSAGCSSGQEAYTLAMLVQESGTASGRRDARILATDLSQRMLTTAKAGVYAADEMSDVPRAWLERYWEHRTEAQGHSRYHAGAALRQSVQFARLNLMDRWPMHGPFDAIFCRNVMIYFDKAAQQELITRYWQLLRPGGHLFVSHSESLIGLEHGYRFVQPAVYVK